LPRTLPLFFSIALAVLAVASASAQTPTADPRLADLDRRYQALTALVTEERYGVGGPEVLRTAYDALSAKHEAGEGLLVGLEDLWTHACQEGQVLFRQPERLWGKTGAEETADMIGQTTIGPWQLTVQNIRNVYGPPYGVDPAWDNARIYTFCREHPEVQAAMIIDYIQRSYEAFGRRGPYSIQRYFWLEPFVRGELGQGVWYESPVAKAPDGDWSKLTAEMKRNTGFYAKQIVLGARYTQRGLVYWLAASGDHEGAREVLRTWRDQRRVVADAEVQGETGGYRLTDEPGGFAIAPEDIIFPDNELERREALQTLAAEVLAEAPSDETPLPTVNERPR